MHSSATWIRTGTRVPVSHRLGDVVTGTPALSGTTIATRLPSVTTTTLPFHTMSLKANAVSELDKPSTLYPQPLVDFLCKMDIAGHTVIEWGDGLLKAFRCPVGVIVGHCSPTGHGLPCRISPF